MLARPTLIARIRASSGARDRGYGLSAAAADLMSYESAHDAADHSAGYVVGVASADNFDPVYDPDVGTPGRVSLRRRLLRRILRLVGRLICAAGKHGCPGDNCYSKR